jgi:Fe-S cluster biosynthesis and repair protein YggX
MARTIQCTYLKKEAEGLDFPPYPGELGKRIYDNISKEAFELWKRHQTMLVNENRLNLADARARQYLARQMEQFLFGGGAASPPVTSPQRLIHRNERNCEAFSLSVRLGAFLSGFWSVRCVRFAVLASFVAALAAVLPWFRRPRRMC